MSETLLSSLSWVCVCLLALGFILMSFIITLFLQLRTEAVCEQCQNEIGGPQSVKIPLEPTETDYS